MSGSGPPVILGTATAEVSAGALSKVTIAVSEVEPVVLASLQGRVFVPPAWEDDSPRFMLKQLSAPKQGSKVRRRLSGRDMRPVEGSAGAYEFTVEGLETGQYSLTDGKRNFTETLELPPEGLSDFEFHVPAPVEVTLSVVDRATGEDVPGIESIAWSPRRPEGVTGFSSALVERDPTTNQFLLRVPDCDFSARVSNHDYVSEEVEFTPVDGGELVLKV